ncbi:MAG: hypothetical protein U9R03_04375, partial [Candidatus Aerophobetes bacterium]|nr:hypothetical protein [Candidatus Aerophobetes bacterium]
VSSQDVSIPRISIIFSLRALKNYFPRDLEAGFPRGDIREMLSSVGGKRVPADEENPAEKYSHDIPRALSLVT